MVCTISARKALQGFETETGELLERFFLEQKAMFFTWPAYISYVVKKRFGCNVCNWQQPSHTVFSEMRAFISCQCHQYWAISIKSFILFALFVLLFLVRSQIRLLTMTLLFQGKIQSGQGQTVPEYIDILVKLCFYFCTDIVVHFGTIFWGQREISSNPVFGWTL